MIDTCHSHVLGFQEDVIEVVHRHLHFGHGQLLHGFTLEKLGESFVVRLRHVYLHRSIIRDFGAFIVTALRYSHIWC